MNNQIQVFKEQEVLGKNFRIYGDAENFLFLAKDVAEWIEHSNPRSMIKTVDDDEKVVNNVYTLGGNQEMWFLTEHGLYEVLMQSRKPIAKEFKKEVKNILTQIRKTGGYIPINQDDDDSSIMAKALLIANKTLDNKDKIIKELKPKADHYDVFIDGSNYQTMNDVAKVVGYGRNKLFEFLRRIGILMSDNIPYQAHIEAGRFVVKESVIQKGCRSINTAQTYVTPKGIEYIYKKLREKGVLENAQFNSCDVT